MRIILAVAVLAAWLGTVSLLHAPFWASIAWGLACLALLFLRLRPSTRALWFNVAAIILIVGTFDLLTRSKGDDDECRETIEGDGLWPSDPNLSYRLAPNARATAERSCRGRTVYRATYTTDAYGLRTEPSENEQSPEDCILFFGGSFAFGEGLNDDQTLPYKVGLRSLDRFQVRNFGVSGYGLHHSLAQVESGFVERAAHCHARVAIYFAIADHVARATGAPVAQGDPTGPRYVLQPDGRVKRDGNFGDDPNEGVSAVFGDWAIVDALENLGQRDVGPKEVTLFNAILRALYRRLDAIYPGIELHVLFWDRVWNVPRPNYFRPERLLDGIEVHRISEILPPEDDWRGVYGIRGDAHPTKLATTLLAGYVVSEILPQAKG